jgi:hypothetical protein
MFMACVFRLKCDDLVRKARACTLIGADVRRSCYGLRGIRRVCAAVGRVPERIFRYRSLRADRASRASDPAQWAVSYPSRIESVASLRGHPLCRFAVTFGTDCGT